jgi:CDP-diacylglycerol--serine O-phosphatidyltransferase
MRKGMFVLPSIFTAGNIFAGYYAIAQTLQATPADSFHFDYAARAIGFAILFDGLDGRIARMTSTTSEFGKELDSLADVVTFGVAPAILAYMWGVRFISEPYADLHTKLLKVGLFVTFLFLVAGASRLARFNIQVNPQPSNPGRPGRKYFVGLPIPAGAGLVAAVVHLSDGSPVLIWWVSALWIAMVFAMGYLMVSTWRYYSFKEIDLKRQQPFVLVILIAGLIAAVWFFSGPVLFLLAMTYVLSGVLARLSYVLRRSTATASASKEEPR